MGYVKTFDRVQMMICSWEDFVEKESIARLIDAFVNSLDLSAYEVKEVAKEGRPSYDPRGLYKLYIYGNRKGIRSSRKLADSCKVNLEVKWMMGGVEPDFRTISDFRKDNIDSMKKIFHEFNRRLSGAVEWGFVSVDGSKFRANNGKENNFTSHKLDDRIKWLNARTEEYLRALEELDAQEELEEEEVNLTKEFIEKKLEEAKERLERYEGYRKVMEETGQSQMSIVDADAKLMKSKNGFEVAYNPQTAVDSNTHLIRDFQMTNQVTDHGLLHTTVEGIKEETKEEVLEVTADKGYNNSEDLIKCLEVGVIPHVIPNDGKDGYELEIPYEEEVGDVTSRDAEELRKCLHNGQIPEAYEKVITKIEVKEVRRKKKSSEVEETTKSPYGTEEEMKERAKEGYFVRDPERNVVYCPSGEMLRQKSIKKSGAIRYANKSACRHCKNRNLCYKGKNEWKEIDFTKDTLEKPCREWLKAEGKECGQAKKVEKNTEKKEKIKFEKVKVVKFKLKPNIEKMAQRMCISEHPFGTIKRAMGASYFLLKGKKKVEGEFALFCLGYNLERANNQLGFEKMMEVMVGV